MSVGGASTRMSAFSTRHEERVNGGNRDDGSTLEVSDEEGW